MHSKKIPYDHRLPASEDVFVGRNDIVDWMVDGLRSGYSYGLVGEAGIGKTSTLFALKRELTYRWFKKTEPVPILVHIELNEQHLTREGAIFEAIVSNFIDDLTKQHGLVVSRRETLLEEARRGRLEETVYALSDQYYKHHHHLCRLVLFLDDLHRGRDHKALNEGVSVLRPLVSPKDMAVNAALVLSGELSLEHEFRNDVSSLRGLLSDTVRLDPLLPNDVNTLIALAEDYNWPVEPGSEEVAFTLTGGYPFKLQYYLFTALNRYRRISPSILQTISKDPYVQNYLDTVLKQTSALADQERVDNSSRPQEQKKMSKMVKILFLAANPKDTQSIRLDEEMRDIDSALHQAKYRDRFDVKQHWAVRVTDLQSHILRHKPDIVHFSSHGSISSQIILEDNSGNSHPVSPRALSQIFSILKDNIRCVVLNACYSEPQAQAIAQHIDCVIGMSNEVGDAAAISFATAFYQALGFGRSIKTAFDLGCAQIDLENLNEQDIPKLLANTIDPANIILISDNP